MNSVIKNSDEGRTRCKVFSRVVGFIRPVGNWNDSKSTEYQNRRTFSEGIAVSRCSCES